MVVALEEDTHHGGFSGGGRSSGGFSGGGSYRSPSGGGFYHSGGPHYSNNFHFHSGWGWGPMFGPRPPRRGYSFVSSFICIIVVIILLWVVVSATTPLNYNNKVPENTKQRVALSGAVNKTDWYQDNIGWITNKSVLISGLEDFYNKTGVQPYILFVPYSTNYWNGTDFNANAADSYLETVYSNSFTDEAHFIFAYFQCKNDSKSEMDGEFRYLSGYSADTIMDNEAISILWGYFEKNYYNTSLTIEKMISNTFSETAKSIMSKPTNAWDFANVLIRNSRYSSSCFSFI